MNANFQTVFPELELDAELAAIFGLTEVTNIARTKDGDVLNIYLRSPKLILKQEVFQLERELDRQILQRSHMKSHVIETFELSEQYTPQNLLALYKESIILDFKKHNQLESLYLKNAEWSFSSENCLLVKVSDAVLSQMKQQDMEQRIRKIFLDRCGFDVAVTLELIDTPLRKQEKGVLAGQADQMDQGDPIGDAPSIAASGSEAYGTGASVSDTVSSAVSADQRENIDQKGDAGQKTTGKQEPGTQESGKKKNAENSSGTESKNRWARNGGKDKFPRKPKRFGVFEGLRDEKDPNSIFGAAFVVEEFTSIDQLYSDLGEVYVHGQIVASESRELRNGEKTLVVFSITDFTDTVKGKLFLKNEDVAEFNSLFHTGDFVEIRGLCLYDTYDKDFELTNVRGIRKGQDFRKKRVDNAPVKRVELHCHTKMSEMDAVTDASVLVRQAIAWGHSALAITDHGVVHAFPEAMHALKKGEDFKIIYGVEGYLVDDTKKTVINSKEGQGLSGNDFVVFDIETTGFSPVHNKIIEIGAVKVREGEIIDRFSRFVDPQEPIPFRIEQLTGIDDSMVSGAATIETVLPEFLAFCQDCIFVAHNAEFDMGFITEKCRQQGIALDPTYLDTLGMARALLPHLGRFKLDTIAKELKVSLENHHRAVDDAEATAHIFIELRNRLLQEDVFSLTDVEKRCVVSPDTIKKMPTYHIILLAANEIGRVNLYRMISFSHLEYFNRRPRIPRSMLDRYREGIIVGSACEAGELMGAIIRGESEDEVAKIASYYDYLEIQPTGNNQFMIASEDHENIHTEEDLQALNWRVVKLGETLNKPVVATCDVHFMNPEDEVYRRIIMWGKGFTDADRQAPLYYRTTEEMLEEFQYLGADKAYEVVVTNSNLVSSWIEKISPVRPDKCPPVIENSDVDLRNICYNRAKEMYGDPLPEIVEARLERELESIISNGFAVMYIIAQKLVKKSNEDGYLVGSRGSVGSSFVATMAGITEVNPLSPHYYCKKCHYVDFDSEDVKKYGGGVGCGCDMPDKICPKCGETLAKDGFDIPFETFLGFAGNKEPDIDLNFSGDYQSKAHAYTEVIFGKGHTFRAGTIATVSDKTAYGYVKKYYEEHSETRRSCEIERIAAGCTGIRRSTGQHPGGIIVLPHGEEIYSFTPVQHPANDMTTPIITTHFDYHSIDHNLLKLDILGHDDPTMIRMLEDLTERSAKEFPLDSPEVMSLFHDTSALKISPAQIGGCKLGCLGIPEFGTDFAMQMVIDAKPQSFADLVRLSGLSHGTDVWLGNAKTLIEEGKATIATAICTRDDIMVYLISKGLDKELSFTIMESVRKGKGLKPDWEETMLAHDVPDWYVWSCKKIKYMFPKAHAAAYVMMAWRIAYCKVFYPLAYYAAYFSIRATGFSYELMCMGYPKLKTTLEDYMRRKDELSDKEQNTLRDMRIVQEMYERGYDFAPLDIYQAKAAKFQIMDGKLMPSFASIDGMGEKAAESMEEAAKAGLFVSKDDLRDRAKISKTMIDKLDELGIISDLPDSAQYSLFDGFL